MRWLRIVLLQAALACAFAAHAEGYPTHTVTLVVPFSAGGPTDTIARIVAERLGRALGQTMVVDNTTGAGGSIGVGRVVRATPDGYTIGIGHIGTHVINGAVYKLPYDLQKDLDPVALITTNPQIIVSNNAVPAHDLKELIAWVKANPHTVSFGTGGAGTPSHLSGAYFRELIGAHYEIVHYRGSAPAMQDVIAGHTDFTFDQAASALPLVRSGRIRAYAVTAKSRLHAAPEIPTVDEAGMPGLYMDVWHGIWVPKGTPKAVIARLEAAIVETMADPALRQKLNGLGQDIAPREQQTPEALAAHQTAEIAKWWPVIRAADIKAE